MSITFCGNINLHLHLKYNSHIKVAARKKLHLEYFVGYFKSVHVK